MDGPFNPVEFADFLRGRWRVFAISAAVAVSLALLVSWLIPRRYTATASILIGAPAGSDPRVAAAVNAVYLESLKAYENLALSDTVFARAIDTLKIQELRGAAVESVKNGVLRVSKTPNTAILEIRATLKDPVKAQALAQYIAEQTVELSRSLNSRSSNDTARELRDQITLAQDRLAQAREAYNAFALSEPGETLEAELRGAVDLKSKLDRDLALARIDLAGEPHDPEASSLRAQIDAIESQQHDLAATIANESAQVTRRKNRRDALDADRQSAQHSFEAVSAKLNDAVSAASIRGESLQIIDPGIVPGQPSYPNTPLNLLAALLAALAGSAVWLAFQFSYSRLAGERSARMLPRRQRHDIDFPIAR